MEAMRRLKRTCAVTMLAMMISIAVLGVPRQAKAVFSWPDITAMVFKQALEVAYKTFIDTMVANLKIQAVSLIKGRLEALLTGSSSTPMFITDYQAFIYTSAQQQAQLYVSNFFNSLNAGISREAGKAYGVVQTAVQNEISGRIDQAVPVIDNYVQGGFDNVFKTSSGGGYAAFNAALESNPYRAYIDGSTNALSQMAMQQDINRTQAMANKGFVSKVDPKTNLIDLPGAVVADLTSFVESLPMQVMAFARSIPEVIGTMAANMLSQTIQNGINKVTAPIDNQLMNVHNSVTGGINQVQNDIYKGIKFTDSAKIEIKSNLKPEPPKPPSTNIGR